MGAPSYDAETLAHYFRPLAPETRADPKLAPLLDAIERDDPDLIGAVVDVDRSLLRDEGNIEQLLSWLRSRDDGRGPQPCDRFGELAYFLAAKVRAGRPEDRAVLPLLLTTLDEHRRGR